jgi:adenylate cyclase
LGLLLLGVGAVLILYRGKQKALKHLNHAYIDLSTTKDQLQIAESRLKGLLSQQVSKGVAQELLTQTDKVQKKFVCVMFLDIRGFTPFAEKLNPEELIAYQNEVFGFMIEIIDVHGGVINQFLGDGFMATFGLQDEQSADCDNAFAAAREIVETVSVKNQNGEIPQTRVGIGLHAGKVVAGNVGTDVRKQYSITGNTVITAARIEQLNKTLDSQLLISKEVYRELTDQQNLTPEFTKVQVKGRMEGVELLKIA